MLPVEPEFHCLAFAFGKVVPAFPVAVHLDAIGWPEQDEDHPLVCFPAFLISSEIQV